MFLQLQSLMGSKYVIGTVVAVLITGAVYWGYTDSQRRLKAEIKQSTELRVALEAEKRIRAQAQKDSKLKTEQMSRLNEKLAESEIYSRDLEGKLSKHDLTQLVKAKPGLIERRMNRATVRIFNDFIAFTGGNELQRDDSD